MFTFFVDGFMALCYKSFKHEGLKENQKGHKGLVKTCPAT